MKYIIISVLIFNFSAAYAQFGKKILNKAKETAEYKANQKIDEAVNKGIDKVDSVITGKQKPPKPDKQAKGTEEEPEKSPADKIETPGNTESSAAAAFDEVVITTNIRCETGKKKLETILRDTDGVNSVMIDSDNGSLYLTSEKPGVRNTVIELIGQNGFEADGKKPAKSIPNPCN